MAPKVARRVLTSERSPYGEHSEHSWILDRAATADRGIDPLAEDRLNRERAASEKRAIGSSTLGGLIPAVIEPWVADAVAYGVRSTAVLATALLRLDLPPVGMNVAWAKVTTPATVTNQTAENAALTASADAVVGSATDALGTIGASLDFSVQSQERSGGWFDRVIGEELGRAYGARLEQQVFQGTGASGQLKGLGVMAGSSSSTVSGQTLPLTVNKIADQYQQVSTNLGQAPDLVAMASRRYAALEAATGALGLEATVIPRGDHVPPERSPSVLRYGRPARRDAVPLVANQQPEVSIQTQGTSGR
jgi:hypothetical protein